MKDSTLRMVWAVMLAVLMVTVSSCETLVPVYSYELEETPERTQETAPPKEPESKEPPSALRADADGVVYAPISEWPFDLVLSPDSLVVIFEAEQTGTYEITHAGFEEVPLLMGIYSLEEDDALAENIADDELTPSMQAALAEGETYMLGIRLLDEQDLNRTTEFRISYLGDAEPVTKDEYLWVESPHPHEPEMDIPEDIAVDVVDEPLEKPKFYAFDEVPFQESDDSGAVEMEPFSDDPSLSAETELKGALNGRLTAEEGPYLVTGNITIDKGTTLEIEAGTILRFASGTGLLVRGVLLSAGTSGDEVVLTSDRTPSPGSWRGVIFDGGSGTLEHTRILYAGQEQHLQGGWRNAAIHTLGNADPTIVNSQIAHTKGDAIHLYDTSSPTVAASDMRGAASPFVMHSPEAELLGGAGNRYTDLTNHGIRLLYRNVPEHVSVSLRPYDNLPYYAEGLLIRKGGSLELEAGVVLKIAQGYRIDVSGALSS
ncbi:MAG: hypothetical protein PF495_02880, partial [Spirochaetales bacterium]|nr:hypothetical protein [Spirochaetales bacterium]